MVELLVVITVMLVLAGMTLGATRYMLIKADISRTKALIKQVESALVQYKGDYGFYPQQPAPQYHTTGKVVRLNGSWFQDGGLTKPNGTLYLDLKGMGFNLRSDPNNNGKLMCLDSFDEPIYYVCPGKMDKQSFDLWSKGADRAHGEDDGTDKEKFTDAVTADENNDDICNWKRGF